MDEQRAARLLEGLVRAGVGRWHARRIVLEIADHHDQLTADALARGDTAEAACAHARATLGADDDLIGRYAALPELQAWSSRFSGPWFTMLPLLLFVAGLAGGFAVIVLLGDHWSAQLRRLDVGRATADRVDLAVRIAFLWILPLVVGAACAAHARARRLPPTRPAAGIVLLCVVASLINVGLKLPTGAAAGEASGGVGISAATLPGQAAHALTLATLVLVPFWLAGRRSRQTAVPTR